MSNEEFKELAKVTGVGVQVTAIINGEEFSIGSADPDIAKAFFRSSNAILSTLHGKGLITMEEWKKLGGTLS